MKSQLFRRNPDRYIISDLMEIFNIDSLDNEDLYFIICNREKIIIDFD